jgi:23S rRNA (uracil1939-C5)-methyltransferase
LALVSPTAVGTVVPDDVVLVGADELAKGRRAWFHEEVGGRRWRISARSFFQARPDGAEALAAAVRDVAADLEPGARVVDLYSGVGLFGGTVSSDLSVLAVEQSASAVADARLNLADRRARLLRLDVARWRAAPADMVIADPPRAGLGRRVVDTVAATGATRVALVSCDAASLARDARLLIDHGFRLTATTLVDLFPHTSHIEAVSRFER